MECEWLSNYSEGHCNSASIFLQNANVVRTKLQEWSQKKFRDRKGILQALTTKLTCLKSDPYQNYHGIRVVEMQIDDFLRDEEIYWRQRSKAFWLKEGDHNTRYFHAKASSMKRRNTIDGLLDTNNQWWEDELDIENEFSNYFTTLFTSCTPPSRTWNWLFNLLSIMF